MNIHRTTTRRPHGGHWPLLLTLALFAAPANAWADGASETDKVAQAKDLYDAGSDAFSKGDFATAVTKLGASYDLVPSPTAELMFARALREVGRLTDAEKHFGACEAAARERVAKGDERFKDTADDAATEGAGLKTRIPTVQVTVTSAGPGATVEIDGTQVPITAGRSEPVPHDPGDVTVTLRNPGEAPVTKTAHLVPGTPTTVELTPAPPAPLPFTRKRPWTIPAAIASGGVAVVGYALFAGFGAHAESIYSEFSSCKPHCPASQFADRASAGATSQNVANASVTIAAIATAACATFVVLTLTDRPRKGDAPSTAVLSVSPLGADLVGSF